MGQGVGTVEPLQMIPLYTRVETHWTRELTSLLKGVICPHLCCIQTKPKPLDFYFLIEIIILRTGE